MRRVSKALILLIAILGSSIVYAADGDTVNLTVGRSTVVDTGTSISRVSLTSADVADALVTSSSELLINGKMPGTISMFVWDRAGGIRKYEVNVQRDLGRLSEQLKQLFPGEKITANSSGKSIVLSGEASSQNVVDKAMSVSAGYVDKKDEVVSLLQVLPSTASNQVLLKVRFAEVSRNAIQQLGASWFTNGYKNIVGSVTTGQFPAPFFDDGKTKFSDYLNLFVFDLKDQLGAVIKALQSKGLFQSLAEPNLVAQSGKEASFLAGGEFPIPVAQASGSSVAISIQFKEFGIRLNFLPTIVGDHVQLHVRPEVSTLDFNNAILLQGFRIPALSTRRAETDVELQSGQTFAIAGLLNSTVSTSLQKIPGIGDIPILGNLFRSKAAQKDQTELVVMITPEILPRGSSGVTPNLPRVQEQFLQPIPEKKSMEMPPPAFRRQTTGAAEQQAPAPNASPAKPAAKSNPAAAAAAVSALTPNSVPVVNTETTAPATAATPNRPVTRDEQVALERMKKQDKRQKEQFARQAALDRVKADAEAKRQAASDQRQAAAETAAKEAAARQSAEAARRQAESDRKQAEVEKKQQKVVEEAEARMKAAQAAYDAELTKSKKQ
jgi:pilus assembly protein CpaC